MTMTIKGVDQLNQKFDNMIVRFANEIRDVRAAIVVELVERLIENIPVWSGRTIASLWVDKPGFDGSVAQEHPQRGGFNVEGPFHFSKEFGATSKQPLGGENMRAGAETIARAQASKAKGFTIWEAPAIQVTISSVPWALIEHGKAPSPNQRNRNTAVVSALAIAMVKAKFAGAVK